MHVAGLKTASYKVSGKRHDGFVFEKSKKEMTGNRNAAELLSRLNRIAKDRPFCIMYHAKDDDPL